MVIGRITRVTRGSERSFTILAESLAVGDRSVPLAARVDSVEQRHRHESIPVIESVRNGLGPGEGGAVLGRVLRRSDQGTVIGPETGQASGRDIVLPAGAHLLLTLRARLSVDPQ
jgi:hypothetical protein